MERTRIALWVAACLAPLAWEQSLANPTGPVVVNGAASFAASGATLTVTNSPNAIINWQTFSIGPGELTRFNQQSAMSAVLNRVTTQNPSAILGALQSNGRVFLINPSGILFGPGSQVDVAGLVASTLNLSDADFLAGRLRFASTPGAGAVVNNGAITTSVAGAPVYLIGPAVTNGGIITSLRGEVVLAAGHSVEVAEPGTPNLSVQITATDNEALNLGSILADSGRINLFAGIINQNSIVRANGVSFTEDGRVVLHASGQGRINFGTGSSTTVRLGNVPGSEGLEIPPGGPLEVIGTDIHVAGIVSSGPQTIRASGTLSLASSPASRALLVAVGGQSISAGALTISGDAAQANIENYGGEQTIHVTGDLTIHTAGTSGGIFGVFTDQQTVNARHISIASSGGGAVLQGSRNQTINAAGNVHLTATGDAEPLSVMIGNIPGFSFFDGSVSLNVGGELVLAGNGPGILASELNPLTITTGGHMALEGVGSTLSTMGDITLATTGLAANITQHASAGIVGNSLRIAASGNVDLDGINQVSRFGGTAGGDVTFNNISPMLTTPGLTLPGSRTLALTQQGTLIIEGDVVSGPQAIVATGDILISPAGPAGIAVRAAGPQSIQSGRDMIIRGAGTSAFALVSSASDIALTVGGLLHLNQGSTPRAWARLQTENRQSRIGLRFPNLSSGGWFVNGFEGALRRGQSGFFSGHGVAIPGQSLQVTYGDE
jgi:filamentous hemagglutinin family protein